MSDEQASGPQHRPTTAQSPTAAAGPVTLHSLRALRDFIPREPDRPVAPDTSLPRAVFPWLVTRIADRRRDNLPVSEASLRADIALGFAAQVGEQAVWPEVAFEGATGPRLNLLVRRPDGPPPIAVACQYPRGSNAGQAPATARQLGDLLRDSLRLAKAFGGGLPLQVLLCTDEFRTYLTGLRPPLRLLRPDAAGNDLVIDLPLTNLDDGARTRVAEAAAPHAALHLAFDVLGYAPVGPLHLGMWRVTEAVIR